MIFLKDQIVYLHLEEAQDSFWRQQTAGVIRSSSPAECSGKCEGKFRQEQQVLFTQQKLWPNLACSHLWLQKGMIYDFCL